ncbi:hypothetical protein DPMN_109158 [Dreissena polymorpha]|uniref:Uncharacterized protein n=1 Tax=Dreissena polymorpha TaxID=45954 RepID=A0A9D4KA87_DREPO|nr:hypothetical protein DPMN_109158 [Dreissena polymorpha]
MSVRPRYWLPPALLAHVDDGGVSFKLETPGRNANGRGIRLSVQTVGHLEVSQPRGQRDRSLGCPARFKDRRRRVAAAPIVVHETLGLDLY